MNTGGWIIMSLSLLSVSALFAWCLYKVLTTPGETDHIHGFEKDTPDMERKPKTKR